MSVEKLSNDPSMVALWSTHPLTEKNKVVLGDLKGEPMLFPTIDIHRPYYERVFDIWAKAGYVPNIIQQITTIIEGQEIEIYGALRTAVIELQELEAEMETEEIEADDEIEIEVG